MIHKFNARTSFLAITLSAIAAVMAPLDRAWAQADPAIAFVAAGVPTKLTVMNADGSNATAIYTLSGGFGESRPSWSPSGGSIAFTQGASADLWRIDVSVVNGRPSGSNAINLLNRATSIRYPAWSPLGDEIAFVDLALMTIEVIPAAGGVPTVIYDAPAGETVGSPTWSPDGAFIAFRHGTPTAKRIDIVERATGFVTTALNLGSEWAIDFVDWSRGGGSLAFDLQLDAGGPLTIQRLDLGTGLFSQVLSGGAAPNWSPDDSRLVFWQSGVSKLKTVNLSTGAVTTFKAKGRWPTWRRF